MQTNKLPDPTNRSNIISISEYEKERCKKEAEEIATKIINSKCKTQLIQTLSGLLQDYRENTIH